MKKILAPRSPHSNTILLGSRVILVSKTLVVATFEVCIQLTVGRLPRVVLFEFVGVTTCLFQSDFFSLIVDATAI